MDASRSRITIQFATSRRGVPHARRLREWAHCALTRSEHRRNVGDAVTLRIVGLAESRRLNSKWRGKDKATNVLSFPYSSPAAYSLQPTALAFPLGDLVLCAPVIAREARTQGKTLSAHWAHMIVHGTLHLLGHDHVKNRDAKKMEALEVEILAYLGYQDPYHRP